MKKKLNDPTPIKEIREIPTTKYILLPDGTLARRLKVFVQNDKRYYNISVQGKPARCSMFKLEELAKGNFSVLENDIEPTA
jgi:hypothetical protein